MRRIPILPTVLVALAAAAMIALGIWQLERREEKAAAMRQYRANLNLPATAYPADPTDGAYLFRTVSAHCLHVVDWRSTGGRMPDGSPGWRKIAACATGAEGPGLLVDMGVSPDPNVRPDWNGGTVRGTAIWAPQPGSSLLRALEDGAPPQLMIVSETAAPGLAPSRRPDPSSIPDNHLSYAVQWFIFAALAVIIYVLALRRRMDGGGNRPD